MGRNRNREFIYPNAPLQGSSVPIQIGLPMMDKWNKEQSEDAASNKDGNEGFVPPHQFSMQQENFISVAATSLRAGKDRLKARAAILRATGFVEQNMPGSPKVRDRALCHLSPLVNDRRCSIFCRRIETRLTALCLEGSLRHCRGPERCRTTVVFWDPVSLRLTNVKVSALFIALITECKLQPVPSSQIDVCLI
jgi:hypothetical protein